jgi:uncharacterized protein YecT (DUF1311 family)
MVASWGVTSRYKAVTMQWSEWAKDVVLLLLGGAGTALWFFWRRKAEQAPVFENIQKAEKLLSLRRELDSTNYTVADLKNLEDVLMGRAEAAKELSLSYEEEARQLRELESRGAMTQQDMNVAASRAYQRAEGRLEEVISQMKDFYSPEQCQQFDEANAAWREYQKKNAKFLASRYEGGSIQPLIRASALEGVAIARIVELEAELKFMKDTLVPFKERDAV